MSKQDKIWQLHEDTRQGKNICQKCGGSKQMYYKPWCPRCDKPQVFELKCINLIQCLDHLEAIGNKGIKDRLWERWCDNEFIKGNDIYSDIYFPNKGKKQGIEDYGQQHYEDLMIFKNTFNLGDTITLSIRW